MTTTAQWGSAASCQEGRVAEVEPVELHGAGVALAGQAGGDRAQRRRLARPPGAEHEQAAAGTVPVYRLYLASNGDHFYTADTAQRDSAVSAGYRYEMIAFYAPPR